MQENEQESARLYLVDDQVLVRAALRSMLSQLEGIVVIGDSGDARHAIEEVDTLRPDVILLDIAMPGLSGIDAVAPLRAASPTSRVIMLTHHEGGAIVEQALRAGAQGYLTKDSDPAEVRIAVRAVADGRTYLTPRVADSVVRRAAQTRSETLAGDRTAEVETSTTLGALTPREREVFQLLALGRSNKEVARELGVRLGTVKKHRENLQRKLDCHSPARLSLLAIREGLLDA